MKKIFTVLLFLISLNLFAQDKIQITESDYDNQKVEMADGFRADGKIYVVVTVMLVIMAGMFFYLYRIEKKVKKLENEFVDHGSTQQNGSSDGKQSTVN